MLGGARAGNDVAALLLLATEQERSLILAPENVGSASLASAIGVVLRAILKFIFSKHGDKMLGE